MDKIYVSVVIPTYGRPNKLACAIDSALSQNFEHFEVIVIDDNNPDTEARSLTEQLMHGYESDARVVYIKHEKNKNGAAARNTGIYAARGKYIAFLDDDDIFLDNHIKAEFDFLESHPNHSGAYTWFIQNGMTFKPKHEGDLSKFLLLGNYCAPTPSLMIKKSALLELNGFNENYRRHQDLEMMLRFFEKNTIGVVKQVVTKIGDSDGTNHINGQQRETLKDNFLAEFSPVIDRLEKKSPGIRRKIICKNYAGVWANYIHYGPRYNALLVYKKYASRYPLHFTFSCFAFLFRVARLKIGKKFVGLLKGRSKCFLKSSHSILLVFTAFFIPFL